MPNKTKSNVGILIAEYLAHQGKVRLIENGPRDFIIDTMKHGGQWETTFKPVDRVKAEQLYIELCTRMARIPPIQWGIDPRLLPRRKKD